MGRIKMKSVLKRVLLFSVVIVSNTVVGQSDVDFTMDPEIFIKESDQTYRSKNHSAYVVAQTLDNNYQQLVAEYKLAKDQNHDKLILDYANGKQIFSALIIEKYQDGRDYISSTIFKDLGDNTTLCLIAAFPLKKKDKYYPVLIEAAKVAKLKQQ